MNTTVGTPDWNRVLRVFLEIEAAHYGCSLVGVRSKEGQDGLGNGADGNRCYDGERVASPLHRLAG